MSASSSGWTQRVAASAALRDELDLVRRRVLADLSIRNGRDDFDRVARQLAQGDAPAQGLALEWLEVTLTGADRAVVPLLDPVLTDLERMRALVQAVPITPMSTSDVLRDLIEDRHRRWRRPWITACALYAAAAMEDPAVDVLEAFGTDAPTIGGTDDAAAIVAETVAGLRHRRLVSPT